MRGVLLPCLSLLLAGAAFAQEGTPPRFEAGLDLVYVTVGVQGRDGTAVPDLSIADFTVEDAGQPRPVEMLVRAEGETSDERGAIDVCLLSDTSGSMTTHVQELTLSALRVLERIPRVRRRCVMSFDNDVRVWHTDVPPAAILRDMVAAQKPNGATALRTALVTGIDNLKGGTARSAIILLSDGEDVGSRLTAGEVTAALERSRVTVYPLTHAAPVEQWQGGTHTAHLVQRYSGPAYLSQIASASGGRVFTPDDGDLDSALNRIVAELSSQYVLGFVPSTKRGSHKLKIKVARKDVKVRHRPSYVWTPD
jgi:VWFA-related protein